MKPNQIKSMCFDYGCQGRRKYLAQELKKIIVMKRNFEATLIKAKRFLETIDSMCLTEGAR